jgi:hypothetical protein
MGMKRREFMGYLAGGLAAATLDAKERPSPARSRRISHSAYLASQRIGVSSWSFHNYLPQTGGSDYSGPEETFVLLDFLHMVADRYRVHHLEFVARTLLPLNVPTWTNCEASWFGRVLTW